MATLGVEDWVFLDAEQRPFLCAVLDGQRWLCYWHAAKKWVTLRRLRDGEIEKLPRNLPREQQELYFS